MKDTNLHYLLQRIFIASVTSYSISYNIVNFLRYKKVSVFLPVIKINFGYTLVNSIIIYTIVAAFIFFFYVKFLNSFVIFMAGSFLFVYISVYEKYCCIWAFYLFIMMSVVIYLQYIYRLEHGKRDNNDKFIPVYTLWTLAAAAITTLLIVILPVSSMPVAWDWLDSKMDSVYDYLSGSSSYELFSISHAGYGEDKSMLGGNARTNKKVIMTVTTPVRIYLKGIAKDYYTGYSWSNTDSRHLAVDPGLVDFPPSETSRTVFRLNNDMGYFNTNPAQNTVSIKYENISTRTLFYPLNLKNIGFTAERPGLYADGNENIYLEKLSGSSFKYSTDIYGIDYGNDQIRNLLKESHGGLYVSTLLDEISQYIDLRDEKPVVVYDSSAGELKINPDLQGRDDLPYVDHWFTTLNPYLKAFNTFKKKYLQLPGGLPPRVKELALKITSSERNNYDKLNAIGRYLSENEVYTLSPGNVPYGHDFVDYFLFDGKSGYCTYYATAMTIMARCIGVPTRYVEGYTLPGSQTGKNTYVVTNKEAHAWTEAYFEGFGWVPFEPTPPFAFSFYNSPDMRGYMEEGPGYAGAAVNNSKGTQKPIPKKHVSTPKNLWPIAVMLWVLPLIILIVILYNFIRFCFIKRRIHKLSIDKQVLAIYSMCLQFLKLSGIVLYKGETPTEFSQRVQNELGLSNNSFYDMTEAFIHARYACGMTESYNIEALMLLPGIISKKSRKKIGWLRYFIKVYIAGRIKHIL